MTFQIHALPEVNFQHFFTLSDDELHNTGAKMETAEVSPGYPCVVSLVDAGTGERVLLINYEHLAERSPYRASHAIYVRQGAVKCQLAAGEIPQMLASRTLSVRGYDADHLMIQAAVLPGGELAEKLDADFQVPNLSYVHIHIAAPGCFAARATRVGH